MQEPRPIGLCFKKNHDASDDADNTMGRALPRLSLATMRWAAAHLAGQLILALAHVDALRNQLEIRLEAIIAVLPFDFFDVIVCR
jgi:hypothetical protein